MAGKTNISRSDSIVTVPLWDGDNALLGTGILIPGSTFRIVGFLQLGITDVLDGDLLHSSKINGVILNVSGCGSAAGTPVSGGGISPIPVRLIQ